MILINEKEEKHYLRRTKSKCEKKAQSLAEAQAQALGQQKSDRKATACMVCASQERRINDGVCTCTKRSDRRKDEGRV